MIWREAVYMVLDELKLFSDDAVYTEDHIIFLLSKYRAFLLKQRYSDVKKRIPESNYQTICLDLIQVPAISGDCEEGQYLRSNQKIPYLMKIGAPMVYPIDYYQGDIAYISRERMRYVGHNKYLKNIIYASLGPDSYLYLKSSNPQYLYLEKIRMTGIFESPEDAINLQCLEDNEGSQCDILDNTFPIEESLVPQLIQLVVKELLGAEYRPEDKQNDSRDNLSQVVTKQKYGSQS